MRDRCRRIEVFKPGLGYATILRPVWEHEILSMRQKKEKKGMSEKWKVGKKRRGKARKNGCHRYMDHA